MSNSLGALYIIGTGQHSTVVLDVIEQSQEYRRVFLVWERGQEDALKVPPFDQYETISEDDFKEKADRSSGLSFHVAIGDNRVRERVAQRFLDEGLSPVSVISPDAKVSGSAKVGLGVFIAPYSHVGPLASVGSFAIVNTSSNLEHHAVLGDFAHLGPGSCVCGAGTVGKGAMVGANSVIKESCGLGEWSTLGALSFLNFKHLGVTESLVGAPARLRGSDFG